MHFLLAVLLILNPAYAHSKVGGQVNVFYSPLESSTISAGDYEDIRVDADRDQKIDLWVLRKGPTSIALKFSDGKISSMNIRKFVGGKVQEAQYSFNGSTLNLTSSEVRAPLIMNGHDETLKCTKENEGVLAELTKFTGNVSARQSLMAVEEAVVCDDEEVKSSLALSLNAVVSDDSISKCLKSPEMMAKIDPADKGVFIYLSNKLKLDQSKISHQVESNGLLSCEISPDAKTPKGKYQEGGGITVTVPKRLTEQDSKKGLVTVIYHELLHRTGVIDEKTIDRVMAVCPAEAMEETKSPEKAQAVIAPVSNEGIDNAASKETTKVSSESKKATAQKQKRQVASSASETGGGAEGYNMAKEISSAEVQQSVPSSEKLTVNKINMTDEGKAQAVAASERQSAPVFAMADRAMGVMNTPALASNDSSGEGSSTSSSESGERYQSRYNGYESKTNTGKSASNKNPFENFKRDSSDKSMKVVKEVDLTKDSSGVVDTSGRTTSANSVASGSSRMVASTNRPTGTDESSSEEVSGASSIGKSSGGSGSGTYFNSGSSGGGSNTRKTNANTRSGVAAASASDSRADIMLNFTDTNYSLAKNTMKTDTFQQKMVEYKITVIDTSGSRWGASKGDTVFTDDGRRFIRVK